MVDIELCYMPATEALERFREKSLSPVELMKAIIERAEQVEPVINVFTFKHYEEALQQAQQAEARYMAGNPRPLEGIPLAAKDETWIAGMPVSQGSLLRKDSIAISTTPIAERFLNAGAIVHARTATPEFSCAGVTWSRLWGVSRNPWNPQYTTGGSSGGAAASLAAGTTTLANGSDIAGSIRMPSSWCGIVGFKPPYGRVPDDPVFDLEYYCHAGPMARNIGDCILFENIIAGPHALGIATIKPKLTLPTTYDGIQGWRIAYSLDLGYKTIDPEVCNVLLQALDVFRNLGAVVEEVELHFPEDTTQAALHHLAYCVMGSHILDYYNKGKEHLTNYAVGMAKIAEKVTRAQAERADLIASNIYGQMSQVFDSYDLFICPTTATARIPADFDPGLDEFEINGEKVEPNLGWGLTYPFNMISRCPVLDIPAGMAPNSVPIGMQLVGPSYEDELVFQAAAAFEAVSGPFCSASHRPPL